MSDPLSADKLRQFTGTENWYRHAINRKVLFTDGVKYVAEYGGAFWLLDEIALIQRHDKRVSAEVFQVWKLKVGADRSAELVCEDGNDNIVYSKTLQYTDFPGEGITLWFTDNTILLPSEY